MASEPPTRPLGEPRPDPFRGDEVTTQRDLVEELQRSRTRATAGLVLAILALIAGAIALVLALDDGGTNGGSDRRAATRSSVSDLREDVRALEEDVDELRGQTRQGDDVSQQIEEIDQRLSEISDQQDQTSQQIQDLQDRVDELENQPTPTPTP